MEGGDPPEPEDDLEGLAGNGGDPVVDSEAQELKRREIRGLLRENERRWAEEGDSEALWEQEHDLLIRLQKAGDLHSIMKRARRVKRAKGGRGTPHDLADAALGLWVLERFDEAVDVLRLAIVRLPKNRYPWSLLLRHLTWEGTTSEAMEFILESLDRVPWRGHSLVQLCTLCVDAASRGLVERDLDACQGHLKAARDYLEGVDSSEDSSDELSRTADRLSVLIDTLEKRLEQARAGSIQLPQVDVPLEEADVRLAKEMREAAEASGVLLEGEPDDDLNLDELERQAFMEPPEDDGDDHVTVLEVTPTSGFSIKKRKREED
jgi:hypothetical protein